LASSCFVSLSYQHQRERNNPQQSQTHHRRLRLAVFVSLAHVKDDLWPRDSLQLRVLPQHPPHFLHITHLGWDSNMGHCEHAGRERGGGGSETSAHLWRLASTRQLDSFPLAIAVQFPRVHTEQHANVSVQRGRDLADQLRDNECACAKQERWKDAEYGCKRAPELCSSGRSLATRAKRVHR
jgi:hypothetical protein